MVVLSYQGRATNTKFNVVGLTQPELKPRIYRNRGEHANHYTTDSVNMHLVLSLSLVDGYSLIEFNDRI
jgi:hypothetical protein